MENKQSTFPDKYKDIETEKLLIVFEKGPARVRHAIEGLSCEELATQARKGKWSIQEIVLHLADAEIMGATRIRQCYAEPGCRFSTYNQNIWADIMSYRHLHEPAVRHAVKLFEALRNSTVSIFRRCTNIDWRKTGYHAEQGYITLRNLLELYADHSERHIGQMLTIREILGKPLNFPLLLAERLY